MADHDLVVRGATVVDGTGAPRSTADVAVDGPTITAVGRVGGRGRREIDADGLVVAPGWVDIHSHYDGQVLWDPLLAGSSMHGVTTVVMGNCGVGFAPARPEERGWLVRLMEGVEEIPAAVLDAGIEWRWGSFAEYLDALGRRPLAIDVAAQVPHAALRVYVMGERGENHEEAPTDDEIARMGAEVVDALAAGAVGFSTSRSVLHKSSDGRVTPTYGASPAELLGIARAMGTAGLGVFEVVTDFVELDAEFALLRAFCEVSGRPLSVAISERRGEGPGPYRRQLELLEAAVADGVPMRGQVAPRPPGGVMTLDGGRNPLLDLPTYAGLAHLPLPERVAELRRTEVRQRIVGELEALDPKVSTVHIYGRAFPLDDPATYDLSPERSVAGIAARTGRTREAVVYDLLLERDGRAMIYTPGANFDEGTLDVTRELLVHPFTLPGIGDGGAHCTRVCDTSFPTFLVTHWSRDAQPDERLDLEWVVQQQSAETAAWVGLTDRGVVAEGRKADLNLIELERLESRIPEMASDFPLGGRRLLQRADGYHATVVSGEVVVEGGEHTGALPGAVARPAALLRTR